MTHKPKHILAGTEPAWRARGKQGKDPVLCGLTFVYGDHYWDNVTLLRRPSYEQDAHWRFDVMPSCEACVLLHMVDPSNSLVVAE